MRTFGTRGPEPRVETETVAGASIRSYVIPVIQAALQMPFDGPSISRRKEDFSKQWRSLKSKL